MRLILLGCFALSAAMILLASATTPWQLYAAFILMSFGWSGMGIVVIATVVSAWFVHRRGLAISIAFNGASCGGVVVAPSLLLLVGKFGFPTAMLIATAVMAAVLVPVVVAWVGAHPPDHLPDQETRNPTSSHAAAHRNNASRAMILRRLPFWTIAAPLGLALMAQIGFIVHQVPLLEPKIGRLGTGLAVAVTSSMAVIGRLCLGTIIDRLDPRVATAASVVSQAVALLTIGGTDEVWVLFLACALFGLTTGNLITLLPLIIHREFEAAAFTLVMGLSTAVSGVIGSLGPGLVAVVRDWSGGYAGALVFCVMLQLVAAATVLRGRRQGHDHGTMSQNIGSR